MFVCQLTPCSVSFLTFQAPVHFSMYTDFFVKGTFVFSWSLCLQLLPPLQTPFPTLSKYNWGGGVVVCKQAPFLFGAGKKNLRKAEGQNASPKNPPADFPFEVVVNSDLPSQYMVDFICAFVSPGDVTFVVQKSSQHKLAGLPSGRCLKVTFGRTALCLSGGGAMAFQHFGVVEELLCLGKKRKRRFHGFQGFFWPWDPYNFSGKM